MHVRRSVATLVTLSLMAASSAGAQTTPAPLHYANGQIVEGHLPFSRRFTITGSTITTRGKADVVLLEVWETHKKATNGKFERVTPAPTDRSCWVRPPESAADSFAVSVQPLTLERRYELNFTFARRYEPAVVNSAFQDAADETVRAMGETAISSDSVGKIFTEKLRHALRAAAGGTPKFLRVVAEGRCVVSDTAPAIALDSTVLAALAEHAQAVAAARADLNSVRRNLRTPLDALAAVNDTQFQTLATRLRQALHRAPGAARRYRYDSAAVSALVRAVQRKDASVLTEDAWSDLNEVTKAKIRPPLTSSDTSLLAQVLGAVQGLRKVRQDIAAREADLRDVEAEATTATARVRTVVEQSYTPIAQAGTEATSWGGETEVRKLRIGTGVGGGSARLSPFSNHDWDSFLFVVLRYYLGPVDRSLSRPWSSKWARFSIDVGALFQSTLRYEGQKLTNAFGGLTPVLGVSWDADRYLALSAGVVFFRQPSVNPANNAARENPSAAPYVGLSVDFDALNTLRNLIK
jgi:hypothetical protein